MGDESALQQLGEGFRGALIQPDDEGYDAARRIWNAVVDKRPATRSAARSHAAVLVVAAHPDGSVEVTHSSHHRLVAPAWRAVEPLVHAPEGVQPADVCRVGVGDDPA